MRSIPSIYNHQRFASRLECRWAMWMDLMGIAWAYEPETLDLDGLTYVPDFWLPELRLWVEIKGEIINDMIGLKVVEKCKRLAAQSDRPVILCFDQPFDPKCAVFHGAQMHSDSHWTICKHCGAVALSVQNTLQCPNKRTHGQVDILAIRKRNRCMYDAAIQARRAVFGIARKESKQQDVL